LDPSDTFSTRPTVVDDVQTKKPHMGRASADTSLYGGGGFQKKVEGSFEMEFIDHLLGHQCFTKKSAVGG